MALPNEINVGRFNRLLQALLQIKGPAPSPVLVPEIQPALVLENDRPEWELLRGGTLGAGRGTIAAAVGLRSRIALGNPANSGTILISEAVCLEEEVAGTPLLRRIIISRSDAPADQNAAVFRDLRKANNAGANLGLVGFIGAIQAAVPAGTALLQMTARGELVPLQVIIAPGWRLSVIPTADNLAVSAGFIWRERAMESSELGNLLSQGF